MCRHQEKGDGALKPCKTYHVRANPLAFHMFGAFSSCLSIQGCQNTRSKPKPKPPAKKEEPKTEEAKEEPKDEPMADKEEKKDETPAPMDTEVD